MKKAFVFIDGNNLYFRAKSVAEYYEMETGNKFSTIFTVLGKPDL